MPLRESARRNPNNPVMRTDFPLPILLLLPPGGALPQFRRPSFQQTWDVAESGEESFNTPDRTYNTSLAEVTSQSTL